jgi:hypothetical protein
MKSVQRREISMLKPKIILCFLQAAGADEEGDEENESEDEERMEGMEEEAMARIHSDKNEYVPPN